jgi:hypothetical protein
MNQYPVPKLCKPFEQKNERDRELGPVCEEKKHIFKNVTSYSTYLANETL